MNTTPSRINPRPSTNTVPTPKMEDPEESGSALSRIVTKKTNHSPSPPSSGNRNLKMMLGSW